MKPYILASCLFIGFVTSHVQACVNDYHLRQERIERSLKVSLDIHANRYDEQKRLNTLTKETINDYGVLLIRNGKYAEAIDIFTELETRFPNIAMTAANLGTAYELHGDNEKALYWIKKGVERDHNEHNGTEWLHVKILEAKIAMLHDNDWLAKNNVVGLPVNVFNTQYITKHIADKKTINKLKKELKVTDFLGKTYDIHEIEKAIRYQTAERRRFVKPPNAVMADLYHSKGLLKALASNSDDFSFNLFFSNVDARKYAPKHTAIYEKVHEK